MKMRPASGYSLSRKGEGGLLWCGSGRILHIDLRVQRLSVLAMTTRRGGRS